MESSLTHNFKFLLLILSIGLWISWLWKRRYLYRFAYGFPGHYGAPIIGSLSKITAPTRFLPVLGKLMDDCKRHTICFWMGLYPVLLTTEPEVIEKVLSSNDLLHKAKNIYVPLNKALGGGLISSPVKHWHPNRKLANPSFNRKNLVSFLTVFHKGKINAISKLNGLVGTGERQLLKTLQLILLQVGTETIMGADMEYAELAYADLVDNFSFILQSSGIQALLSYVNLEILFTMNQGLQQARENLRSFVKELITSKLDSLTRSNNNNNRRQETEFPENDALIVTNTNKIYIDRAVQLYAKQQLSWNEIIAESNTLLSSSAETTGSTLFFAVVMLAMHPQEQEKLYEEIVEIFPDKDFRMNHEHMHHMPYLDRVLKETLRLFPVAPVIGRHVVKDTQLTKDLILPKDLQILISIFHLHRRSDIWGPGASKFDPDHFLPDNMTDKHTCAFIPFSKGRRNCIGWQYAIFAIKVILSGLVRNFRFTTTFKFDDLQFVDYITLRLFEDPGIEVHHR